MKISIMLLIVGLPLVGCNTLKKQYGTGTHDVPNNTKPDDYTVSGVTSIDHQIIEPVRTADSEITIQVRVPGSTDYRTLNKYEFSVYLTGTGGISFGRVEYPYYNKNGDLLSLTITNEPSAPKGTEYQIRSVLKGSVGSHELY